MAKQREAAALREAEYQQRIALAEAQLVEALNAANVARADAAANGAAPLIAKPRGKISLPDVLEQTAGILHDEYKLMQVSLSFCRGIYR